MWKAKKIVDHKSVALQLSGRLEAEHLTELQKAFAAEDGDQDVVVLDMKEVRLVDQEAVTFLAGCEARGVKLRNCPIYIREWITRERETRS
jgi:anti-anti-sigma regulatory factor